MIPIIYESNETGFDFNGLARLRDAISVKVFEERNGVYECDFSYPVTGANFDLIQVGRIIGVTHDDTGDIQPFDIVSYTKPINGIVEFHCTHVSYRQSYFTTVESGANSLADAFYILKNQTVPANRLFTYESDMTKSGYVGALNGVPRTVRSVLGGVEGSILDTFGGEYEWDKWKVILHSARGTLKPFSVRYGVNMLDYKEDFDIQGTYMRAIPFWKGTDDEVVFAQAVSAGGATITNRQECVPLDISDKFQNKPTSAAVSAMGQTVINSLKPYIPIQNIHIEFVRLQDLGYPELSQLMKCGLCDTINVIFPEYDSSGQFKIVKTVWDVLADRYESMELGDLSVTLADALGGSSGSSGANPRGWFYVNSLTATTIASTSTNTKVPITAMGNGSGFVYDTDSKGIKCVKGGLYAISAQIEMDTATSGDLIGVSIYKNGAAALGPAYMRMGGNYDSAILMPTFISLAADDVLTLYLRNNTAGRGVNGTGCRIMCWEV